jgi:branched-chain amino acid transport system ATP-binding protein
MLEVEGIHTYYGLSHILFGVSLDVKQGEVVCLLGRNGAGKTTTMKSIIGITPPSQGSIRFKGKEINGLEPYLISRMGIGYIPDDRRIFPDLTVEENLEIAVRRAKEREGWTEEKVYELFPQLRNIKSRKGGCLSGGEQKMLAIARALMGNPEFILLDEPFEGLAPLLIRSLEDQIKRLRDAGLTVLIAEQNVRSTLRISDRGYIIDDGHIRYHGSIEDLRENEEVRKRYLLV